MTSWFLLSEGVTWQTPSISSSVELEYRYGHLGPRQAHHCAFTYSTQSVQERPSDGGPPLWCIDMQALLRGVGRAAATSPSEDGGRRGSPTGPRPGIVSGCGSIRDHPSPGRVLDFPPSRWRGAVWGDTGLHEALAVLSLACGDAPVGGDLSIPLMTDLVWFLARGAMVLHWMDLDRDRRLDSTEVLPVVPACREILLMTTMRIALDKGLPSRIARRFVSSLLNAAHEVEWNNEYDVAEDLSSSGSE
jgi:hypothetical protein